MHVKDPMCSSTFCMNNTLWDTLTVEVGEEVDQVEVLEEERTVWTSSLGLVWMRHRDAIAGGIEGILGLGIPVISV